MRPVRGVRRQSAPNQDSLSHRDEVANISFLLWLSGSLSLTLFSHFLCASKWGRLCPTQGRILHHQRSSPHIRTQYSSQKLPVKVKSSRIPFSTHWYDIVVLLPGHDQLTSAIPTGKPEVKFLFPLASDYTASYNYIRLRKARNKRERNPSFYQSCQYSITSHRQTNEVISCIPSLIATLMLSYIIDCFTSVLHLQQHFSLAFLQFEKWKKKMKKQSQRKNISIKSFLGQ